MQINKEELKKALEIVKPGLANKEIIEQSTSFAFMKDKVVTYNDEISISHPISGLNITGALKAEELYQLISKTKKDEIEIIQKDNQIILQSGRSKAGLILQTDIKLPLEEIGEIEKWKTLPENFSKAVKFVSIAAGTDMSKPVLTCIHIDKSGYVEASDGFRIVKYENIKIPVNTFLIPASSARELIKLNPTKIAEGQEGGWIHFQTNEGTIISCRVFEDKFPDTSELFKVEGVSLTMPAIVSEIIDRAIVFSKRDHSFDERVSIVIQNNKIKISAKSETGSWFEEDANMRFKDEKISFAITPYLLQDILKETYSFVINENMMKFEGTDWLYVTTLCEKSE